MAESSILVLPLKQKHQKRVAKLIETLGSVALKGGGKVPLPMILEIAHWEKKSVGIRAVRSRGALVLNSKKGTLEGTFMNTGKPMKEVVENIPMMKPELLIGRRIDGFFKIVKNQLILHHIRGISVHNEADGGVMDITYKVQQITIAPDSVALA